MHTGIRLADLFPALRSIITVENTAMILLPQMVRLARATGDKMRIVSPLGLGVRQIVHQHAAITARPGLTAIGRFHNTSRGYRNMDMIRVLWIHHDGMDAWFEHPIIYACRRAGPMILTRRVTGKQITAATCMVPERPVELPTVATIITDKQATGYRAGV